MDRFKVVSVTCYDDCVGFHFNSCSPCVCVRMLYQNTLCNWHLYSDQSHMGPLFCSNPLATCLGMWGLTSSYIYRAMSLFKYHGRKAGSTYF